MAGRKKTREARLRSDIELTSELHASAQHGDRRPRREQAKGLRAMSESGNDPVAALRVAVEERDELRAELGRTMANLAETDEELVNARDVLCESDEDLDTAARRVVAERDELRAELAREKKDRAKDCDTTMAMAQAYKRAAAAAGVDVAEIARRHPSGPSPGARGLLDEVREIIVDLIGIASWAARECTEPKVAAAVRECIDRVKRETGVE